MKVRLDETLFKAKAQENLAMTNEINKFEQVDALVECLDHFVADRKWVDEITRDELLTMVTQSHGDKEVLIESVLAKFNTPCIDTKKLKECKERRQNKGLKESMKKRKSLKESDNRDTFTLDTSNTPILDCGLYYSLLGELSPAMHDGTDRFKEFEECVKECAEPILDELVRKTPNFEVVSVGSYYHPRYYNYETDSLEFTVKYTGDELGTVIEEYSNNQDFIDFLQNYKSYDGFISFYADNKEDFVTQDYIKSVSQIIKYNVTQEEYERANEELYYDVMDCGFYPEDEYEDETDESLKEKKYDIYVNGKYVASSDRHKRAKDIEDNIRKDGKIKYAGEKAIKTAGVELDELNVDAKDKLKVKRARESKEKKNLFMYRIYMKNRDKDYASGKDYKDAKSMLKDAKKDFELALKELRTNPKQLICKLYSFEDDDYYNYKDLTSVKEIEDEIKLEATPSKKESCQPKKKGKKLKEGYIGQTLEDFFYDCVDPDIIGTVSLWGDEDEIYNGDYEGAIDEYGSNEFIEFDCGMDKVLINVDTSEEYQVTDYFIDVQDFVDCFNGDEIEVYDINTGETLFSGDRYDLPDDVAEKIFVSFDAPNFISINIEEDGDNDEGEDDFDESLKSLREDRVYKDYVIEYNKPYNYYIIRTQGGSVVGYINGTKVKNRKDIETIINNGSYEKSDDYIKNENLKESLEDDMEKLPHVVSAYNGGGKYILKLQWRPTRKKAHSDYVDLAQALKKKFGDVNINLQTQDWRDGDKETRYILEVELKDKPTNENLKESTTPVKDLLVKTDNKYGITLDHAIDDIKRERGYNDPLFGDNEVIDLLMRRFGLEFRDVIRVLNYKFDGKVLDEGCGRKKIGKRAK